MKKQGNTLGYETVSSLNNKRDVMKVCTQFNCQNRLSCLDGILPDDYGGLL